MASFFSTASIMCTGGLKRETGMKRSAYQLRPRRTNSHRPLTDTRRRRVLRLVD
jgi:hypothetical protein